MASRANILNWGGSGLDEGREGTGVGETEATLILQRGRYCLSSWGSPGKPVSSGDPTPSGSSVARTFLFSLKRPEREIFKLRRLLAAFSPAHLSGFCASPAPLPGRLGCWFSRELLVQSGLGDAGSPGAGWAAGCGPPGISLLFFLLFVSDFHQGPEPPLSAMASGPGRTSLEVGSGPFYTPSPASGNAGRAQCCSDFPGSRCATRVSTKGDRGRWWCVCMCPFLEN